MYLTNSSFTTPFADLGIIAKYNLSDEDVKGLCAYWSSRFGRYCEYQRLVRKFFLKIRKCIGSITAATVTLPDINTKIENICVSELKIFSIYNKSDIEKSKSYQYLNEITGKNLTEILKILNCMNMKIEMPYYYKTNEVGKVIEKILNYHLIFNFAREFYFVKTSIKYGVCNLFTNYIYPYVIMEITNYIKTATSPIDKPLDITAIKNNYGVTIPDGEKEPFLEMFNDMYADFKINYEFMTTNIDNVQNACAKNVDLDISIGKFYRGRKTIPKLIINKYMGSPNTYYVRYLLENNVVENIEEEKIIFRMPESKSYNKMLIVEV